MIFDPSGIKRLAPQADIAPVHRLPLSTPEKPLDPRKVSGVHDPGQRTFKRCLVTVCAGIQEDGFQVSRSCKLQARRDPCRWFAPMFIRHAAP